MEKTDVLRSVKDSYLRQNEKHSLNNKDNRTLTTHRQRRRRDDDDCAPSRSVISDTPAKMALQ